MLCVSRRLGLVVIDEQQKFGVQARSQLRTYNPTPHVLHMSATPIPRTLAMCQVGEQALSCIRGRPTGRPPVVTSVISSKVRCLRVRVLGGGPASRHC